MNGDEPWVSEFIQKDTEQWDVPKLHSMFNKQDTATILTIPLSKGLPEDKQIWTATPHGRFTVNSAYRLILEKELQGEGESSKGNPMGRLWRAIWYVALPNNLKVFMWRALHNALPTLANLEHRKVIQTAWYIGIKRVILEGDLANTNKALGSLEEDYSWLGNEVKEARHLLQSFEL
jgi:hypothetical protein